MISLDERDRQPELMDQPGLDDSVHRRALAGLRTVNMFSRTAGALWRGLADMGLLTKGPVRVLDIASGGGDNVLRLAAHARQAGVDLMAHGCDISATAVAHAQAVARQSGFADVRYFQLNALADPLPQDYDVLMCTLFLHHLAEGDAEIVMRLGIVIAGNNVLFEFLSQFSKHLREIDAAGRMCLRFGAQGPD